ncbi:XtrA/YqaO family protein [Bacillus altitudinis]|uniref:XtrA/YqaO family protein n=1 Tax=Bacillus altitudinis TaxID=293387 RepID=A0ABV1S7T2_BACAB|nr:XtrA/YqaO family protein [Bacillus altitudinis]
MNQPKEIKDFETTIHQNLEPGRVRIIVIDGNEGTAHITDAPEHGHTIIETIKGKLDRIRFDYGFKFNK